MKKSDFLILNSDDENLYKLKDKKVKIFDNDVIIKSKILWFGFNQNKIENGAYLSEENLCYKSANKVEIICKKSDVKVLGEHNLCNILAMICVCKISNIKNKYIISAIQNFKGVEHRLQFVKSINGVDYINDSKSTTPMATETAIESIKKPIILILGGSDKGLDYDEFIEKISSKVKMCILTGEIASKIEKSFKKNKITNYKVEKKFYDACNLAKSLAENGDCVLLSPATSSYDCFKNFEQRGEVFMKIVESFK